jgi:hypothetical protein
MRRNVPRRSVSPAWARDEDLQIILNSVKELAIRQLEMKDDP